MIKETVVPGKTQILLRIASILALLACAYNFFMLAAPPKWTWILLIVASVLTAYLNISNALNKNK